MTIANDVFSKAYDVEVKVVNVKGTCGFGHKVGNIIRFDGRTIEGEICYASLLTLLPKIYAMRFGVDFPWLRNDAMINECPDPAGQVIWEIKRVRK